MNTERAPVRWGFWLWWVLATTVGLAVGGAMALAVVLASAFDIDAPGEPVGGQVLGALVGASVGIAQWLVLRLVLWRQISLAGWWVLASTVGVAVGVVVLTAPFAENDLGEAVGVVVLIATFSEIDLEEAVGVAVLGASVGIAQWLVLRRQVSGPARWALASTVGLAVGFGVGLPVGGAFDEAVGDGDLVGFVGLALGFAIYGAITGAVLVRLLRQPVTEERLLQDAA